MKIEFEGLVYESKETELEAYDLGGFVLPDGRLLSVGWLESYPPQVGSVKATGHKVVQLKPAS